MTATYNAIVAFLTAEDPNQIVVDADGAGFTMVDPEYPKDTALHVWFDVASAVENFADLVA